MKRLAVVLLCLSACARAATSSDSGIQGTVLLGPTCPVEQAGSPCPDRPLSTELTFVRAGAAVARATSGADGSFRVTLEPGTYDIEARGLSAAQSLKPTQATVRAGEYTTVTVRIDSGIR
jgi:hypothetical protein